MYMCVEFVRCADCKCMNSGKRLADLLHAASSGLGLGAWAVAM